MATVTRNRHLSPTVRRNASTVLVQLQQLQRPTRRRLAFSTQHGNVYSHHEAVACVAFSVDSSAAVDDQSTIRRAARCGVTKRGISQNRPESDAPRFLVKGNERKDPAGESERKSCPDNA